jgi:SAM-dependent methyltransferase
VPGVGTDAPAPLGLHTVDELTARRARSFGPIASTYDRVRPGYPPDGVSWLLAEASAASAGGAGGPTLRPAASVEATGKAPVLAHAPRERWRVLEIGAGTGALTRDLVDRGLDVVAVEPDPQMRAVLEQRVPGADVRSGHAEDLPVEDGSVDVVIGAQMWHWVELDQAVPEVARALRPGGTLGLMWNLRDEAVPWMAELGAVFSGDDAHHGVAHVRLPAGAPFTATAARDFRWSQELAPDDIVDLVATRSQVQVLPDDERADLLAKVASFVQSHPAVAGRNRIVVPYVTSCWRATRI